jgi:hypothetical protein
MNQLKLSYEHLIIGISSVLYFPLVWLAFPFGVYAVLVGRRSLRLEGFNIRGFLSLFLGYLGIIISLVFLAYVLPDLVRELTHYGRIQI